MAPLKSWVKSWVHLWGLLFLLFAILGRVSQAGLPGCEESWGNRASRALFWPELDREPGSSPNSPRSYRNYLSRLDREGLRRKACRKDWLILIEMDLGKDKDLLPYAYGNLLELEAAALGAGSSGKADILVQFHPPSSPVGRWGSGSDQRIHVFPSAQTLQYPLSEAQVSQLSRGDIQSPVVEDSHSSVEQFVKWGREEYPAKNVLLIYWGHGAGWQDSARFAWKSRQKVDLVACDSCLMQSVEGVCQLAPCCDFLTGCENIQGLSGLPYAEILAGVNQGRVEQGGGGLPGNEPRRLADLILELFEHSFRPLTGQPLVGPSQPLRSTRNHLDPDGEKYFLFSTVETGALQKLLLPALDQLAETLGGWMNQNPKVWAELKRLIQKGESFRNGNQDLGLFLAGLWGLVQEELEAGGESADGLRGVVVALSDLRIALESTVVKTALGSKYLALVPPSMPESGNPVDPPLLFGPVGLGIWLPPSDFEYHQKIKGFKRSDFYRRHTSWVKFLARMYPIGIK